MRESEFVREVVEAGSLFRGIDPENKSVNFTDAAVSTFFSTARSFAIYDADSDTTPYNKTFSNVPDFSEEIRFGFTGDKTEEQYFPFDPIIVNTLSDPNPSQFDFRDIPKGVLLQFDIEFTVRIYATGVGTQVDKPYLMYFDFEYPNGDIQTKAFQLPYTTELTRVAQSMPTKLSFYSYIKDDALDQLLGGKISFYGKDPLSSAETIQISDLALKIVL